MPKCFNLLWACAYYKKHESTKIYCNCGEMSFPDKNTTGQYAIKFCANVSGWRYCSLAKAWNEFYERKDNEQSRADQKIKITIRSLKSEK